MKKQPSRRSGGSSGNTRRNPTQAIKQIPWMVPRNSDAPTQPLSEDGVHAIHDGSMRILEEIGIEFINAEAKDILNRAGCTVATDSDNVRFDRDFIIEQVRHAPSEFCIVPRNPAHTIRIGGDAMVFGNVASPPNCSDLDRGRRPGDRRSFRDLTKLGQYFNCIHLSGGYAVEPVDIHPAVRHLDCLYDQLTLTDKVVHAYSLGRERVEDVIEMVRIASGLTAEEFADSPRMFTNINSSSPLKHDFPMLDGAMRLARLRQPVIVTPFTLSGAMAPVTIPGAVMQQNAEALAAIALLQVINAGTPVVYGSFTSNVDMKTGAPVFGTPESMRATQMSGQMARFYGLPLRASNACAANCTDPQAAWESTFSLWSCVSSRTNVVYHAAGWLEGGLCTSYEKLVMDCETVQQIIHYMRSTTTTETDLGFDAILEVGPNGHFFGASHTQSLYETAFYEPFISNWDNFENWQDRGSIQAPERANTVWKEILAEFEPPPMDAGINEELQAFVAHRKEAGGAPTDF